MRWQPRGVWTRISHSRHQDRHQVSAESADGIWPPPALLLTQRQRQGPTADASSGGFRMSLIVPEAGRYCPCGCGAATDRARRRPGVDAGSW